jgi:hypothetical protein
LIVLKNSSIIIIKHETKAKLNYLSPIEFREQAA